MRIGKLFDQHLKGLLVGHTVVVFGLLIAGLVVWFH